jgi:DNA-binding CsgD family transcriptional regulator
MVRKVAEVETSVPPKMASKLTESLACAGLSARELQDLRQIGGSNKKIGEKLCITEHMVKAHVNSTVIRARSL